MAITRRQLLTTAAAAPIAALGSSSPLAAQIPSQTTTPPPPKYRLAANLELMFPESMPHAARMELIAAQGLPAFGFWRSEGKDHKSMLEAQQRLGLECCSISGTTDPDSRRTGLTHTGFEAAFLKDFQNNCERAKLFGCKNLICFIGQSTTEVPLDVQHRQFIDGLRKAGDIAAKYDVYFCLEALNPINNANMSVLRAQHAFKIIADVNHPHVLVDFDIYHLAMGDGNIINNLREGLRKKWIRFVEIGDVPERKEPGSGETNYENIFKVLREEGFDYFVGMEHGTTSTPEHAMQMARKIAGV
jgi:hydroxypyruvate isomerase